MLAAAAVAQVGSTLPAQSAAPTAGANPQLLSQLDQLQTAASQANLDIAHMRIEKWKADAASKQQAQANSDALQRNLSSALPGLIANFKAEPQNLNAGFKLYRNLNALYDVLASFTEDAGAFGPKNEYEALAQQVNIIDSVRRNIGDNIEGLTALTESELSQLRGQVHTMQQAAAAAAAATPPKKLVVENDEAPKKAVTHKKKATAASSGTSSTKPASGTPASAPAKSQ